MNLLIIGNGFDLAHDLPTQYKDFLKFVNLTNAILDDDLDTIKNIENSDGNDNKEIKKTKDFKEFINSLIDKENFKYIEELHKLSIDNLWINYFTKYLSDNKLSLNKNWIDFETEISNFVKRLESLSKTKQIYLIKHYDKAINNDVPRFEAPYSDIVYLENLVPNITKEEYAYPNRESYCLVSIDFFEDLKEKLIEDLKNLIRSLEIYLSLYVNNLETNLRIPEIFKMRDKINYVLSFNYTNTFERLYARPDVCKVFYDYIHGKANIENTVDDCQLVLGIDEYLDEEERNKNIDFIQYKKYFQRIYKKTGLIHVSWLKSFNDCYNITRNEDLKEINIHIVGHSLDITDKDILKNIIMFDKQENHDNKPTIPVNVTIYDHNKKSNASHIANLVRVITQEELIKGVYGEDGKNPKIVFKHQHESIALYRHITQAAHNDYLDEPGEKENIQSDLDEMDSWDNEE